MAEGRCRAGLIQIDAELTCNSDWPDFGPGRLPTNSSQGVQSTNILNLWRRLDDDHRTILEETLRGLPMSRFIWFEEILDHFVYRQGKARMMGDLYLSFHLIPSSPLVLSKLYLEILTTPGREPGKPQYQTLYNSPITHNA